MSVSLPIVDVGPEMRVGRGLDQLHVDPHLVVGFLHAAFEDVRHAELLRDLAEDCPANS